MDIKINIQDKVLSIRDFIKDNKEILILIPTVLGGFWQLIELLRMDVSFVRFFSITQVVSDGLIILFLIVNYLIIHWLVFFEDIDLKNEKTITDSIYVKLILFLFIALIFGIVVYKIYNKQTFNTIDLAVVIYTGLLFLRVLRDLLVYRFGQELKKKYLLILVVSSIPLILININNLTLIFHNLFHSPNNIKNIEYLECYTGKKKKDFELLYFNDKYVFVKDIKSKQIEIINFEEMLNKDNCK